MKKLLIVGAGLMSVISLAIFFLIRSDFEVNIDENSVHEFDISRVNIYPGLREILVDFKEKIDSLQESSPPRKVLLLIFSSTFIDNTFLLRGYDHYEVERMSGYIRIGDSVVIIYSEEGDSFAGSLIDFDSVGKNSPEGFPDKQSYSPQYRWDVYDDEIWQLSDEGKFICLSPYTGLPE